MSVDERQKDPLWDDLRKALDERAAQLGADDLRQLRHARQQALAAVPRRWFGARAWAWPGVAVAATVMLTVALWPGRGPAPSSMALMEDIEILTADENIELYDDLEFYSWLADEHAAPVVEPDTRPRG